MMPVEITTRTVRVWQVDGKGKTFRKRHVAYRWAALKLVNAKCAALHEHDTRCWCRYCMRTCDGRGRADGKPVRHLGRYTLEGEDSYQCEQDETHSYRFRLVGRLARWLQWRDGRKA